MALTCECGSTYMGCIDIMPLQGKRKYTHLLCYLMICAECGSTYVFRPDVDATKHQLQPLGSPQAKQLITDSEIELYTGTKNEF